MENLKKKKIELESFVKILTEMYSFHEL